VHHIEHRLCEPSRCSFSVSVNSPIDTKEVPVPQLPRPHILVDVVQSHRIHMTVWCRSRCTPSQAAMDSGAFECGLSSLWGRGALTLCFVQLLYQNNEPPVASIQDDEKSRETFTITKHAANRTDGQRIRLKLPPVHGDRALTPLNVPALRHAAARHNPIGSITCRYVKLPSRAHVAGVVVNSARDHPRTSGRPTVGLPLFLLMRFLHGHYGL
jgi:hypothetical protein